MYACPQPFHHATDKSIPMTNLLPPIGIHKDSNFYTRLVITTLTPFAFPPLIWIYLACVERAQNANIKALAWSIEFFLLILSMVSTVIFSTFGCTEFDDNGDGSSWFLTVQLSLPCDESQTRNQYTIFASLMVMVYPCGIPLLMYTTLFYLRDEIDRVMQDATQQGKDIEDVLSSDENRVLRMFRHSLFEKYKPR
jgi:hypothetical protein